ncbi:hypothetical protein BXY66_3833 [Shimia isoporae]|uniref:Uncharacterized protein n=1 Tax=Shimia isoporae TaxID=647720 RepID=A0A4R1N2E1_9RHOB|nr:hypothetical protein BXY66_3833 [Shimia isoporae]
MAAMKIRKIGGYLPEIAWSFTTLAETLVFGHGIGT